MKQRVFEHLKEYYLLYGILLFAALLRMSGLEKQSLWLDELHTMNEADPAISWGEMIFTHLKLYDQHPPLFFVVERIFFTLFGHSAWVARLVSALAGIVSIWALYLLGREMLNKRLGLIAALLGSVNYFHIYYSQEARGYMFAFLFATLSFLYLLRFYKSPQRKHAIAYAIFSLLLLYSHYYSLFVIIAQIGCTALFFFLTDKSSRKSFLKLYLLAGAIIALVYAPWLPFLAGISGIKSFWIQATPSGFAIDYFYEFFGQSDLLKPFLLLFIISYFIHLLSSKPEEEKKPGSSPAIVAFLLIACGIFIMLFVPFLRSLLQVPMLHVRYTIVSLPLYILLLAWGIDMIKQAYVRYTLLGIFILLSFTDLIIIKRYYKHATKTQFREMTRFIADFKDAAFPVINQKTGWHQSYYLKQENYGGLLYDQVSKEVFADSMIRISQSEHCPDGFWLAAAHGEAKLPEHLKKGLDTSFILVREKDFIDSWAILYISQRNKNQQFQVLDYHSFQADRIFDMDNYKTTAIWEGQLSSNPIQLAQGHYKMFISAKGTPASGEYPHLKISLDQQTIGDYYTSADFSNEQSFEFDLKAPFHGSIQLLMDNDKSDPVSGEDRNLFIRSMLIYRVNQ